jgi:hypothetical protein
MLWFRKIGCFHGMTALMFLLTSAVKQSLAFSKLLVPPTGETVDCCEGWNIILRTGISFLWKKPLIRSRPC